MEVISYHFNDLNTLTVENKKYGVTSGGSTGSQSIPRRVRRSDSMAQRLVLERFRAANTSGLIAISAGSLSRFT